MRSVVNRFLSPGLAMVLFLAVAIPGQHAGAEVSGTTWTGSGIGCVVTWSSPWFFVEERSEPAVDILILSARNTFGQFQCTSSLGMTPEQELMSWIVNWCNDPSSSDCQQLLDANGESHREVAQTYASDVYTFTEVYDDGTSLDLVARFQIQTATETVSLGIVLLAPAELYQESQQAWNELLAANPPPGTDSQAETSAAAETGDSNSQNTEGTSTGATSPDVNSGGEPAPVIATGTWRFAAAAITIGATIPSLELAAMDGREWLVVVADVSNWTATDSTFNLRDPLVQTDVMTEPWDLAPSSTRQVAAILQLTAQGDEDVAIAAGETVRIVLVYSLPSGGSSAWLLFGAMGMDVSSHFDLGFDPAQLPPVAAPPSMNEAIFTEISMDEAGTVLIAINGGVSEFTLIGVDVPAFNECYGPEALALVATYILSPVILESETAFDGTNSVYLWIIHEDGSKTLLNQEFLANGYARVSSLPAEARFATWLTSSEETAQLNAAGLWGQCA